MDLIRKGRYERRNNIRKNTEIETESKEHFNNIIVQNDQTDDFSEHDVNERTSAMMQAVEAEPDLIFKVIVIGDIAVGKTCLLQRAANDKFMRRGTTIGPDMVNIVQKFQD